MHHHSFRVRVAAACSATGLAVLLAGGTGVVGAMAATSPSAPVGLTATPGDGTATLSWSTPATDGAAVTDYFIVGGKSPSGETISDDTTGHTDTFSGLANGTVYYFRVLAQSPDGPSPTASVQVTPQAVPVTIPTTGTVPSAPTNVKASGGDGFIALSWSPPRSNGGFPVTGYHVYRGLDQSLKGAREITVTGTSFRTTDVENGSIYYIKVTALNAAGEGPGTPEKSVYAGPPAWEPTLSGLTARAGRHEVSLSWSPPAGGLQPGQGYWIYLGTRPGGEGTYPWVRYLVEVPYYTIGTLKAGTRYYFKVALVDGTSVGPRSAEVSAVPTSGVGASPIPTPTSPGGGGRQGGGAGGGATPTPIPTTPLPGLQIGDNQPASSSGLPSWLVGLLAGLSVAVAGGGLAAVVLRRRRYGTVPAPRRPYDDQPAERDEEMDGPRYR